MTELIYVEGPDFSGKTTLIESMMSRNDMMYHNGLYPSQEAAFEAYERQLHLYTDRMLYTFSDFKFIIDRGPIAELIYGLIMRGTMVIPSTFSRSIMHYKNLNARFILCLPPLEVAVAGWDSRKEEEYIKDKDKYFKVYQMYQALLTKPFFGIEFEHYDFTQHPIEV